MNRLVFGEADPADYVSPTESATQQTDRPVVRAVALRATLDIRLQRYARSRCDSCSTRRVRYAIAIAGEPVSGKLCARCAGVR